MPKVKKDGKTYHFAYTPKGIGAAKEFSKSKSKKPKKKTMFSRG